MVAITISHKQVSEIFSPENKAIRGHDPVAYFTNIELTKGLEAYKLSHGGALVFLSKENLELFKLNPRLYMPQHGGYYATRLA